MTLSLWLDPSDDTTVTLVSTRVTDIADKSIEGNDVSEVSTSGPTIVTPAANGLDGLQFSSGDYLERVNGSLTNMNGPDFTAMAVVTDDGTSSSFGGIIALTNASFTQTWRIIKSGVNYEASAVSQTPRLTIPASDTAGEATIIGMTNDETADYQEGFLDGVRADSEAQINAGSYATDPFRLGVNAGSFHYAQGYICEVLYFDSVLASDDRQRAEGYLAHKWGIAANLPAGHPFKIRAPDIVNESDLIATFEGADGATSYTSIDTTGRAATFIGNAQLDQQISRYGGSSLLLDGTGDYVTFPDDAAFDLGADDFTIECWVRHASISTVQTYLAKYDSAINNQSWIFRYQTASSGRLEFTYATSGSGPSTILQSSTVWNPTVDVWHHLAVVRRGNVLYMFADGVQIYNAAFTPTIVANSLALDVGAVQGISGTTNYFNGNMDSVRIVKGTALYFNDFDPPHRSFRKPLTAELIANFNGLDAATTYTSEDAGARTATFVGNAQLDDAQKKFGHTSLLLDGTGDYITFPDSVDLEFAGGDFTAECWIRFSSDPGTSIETFVGKWDDTGNQREWLFYLQNNQLTLSWTTDGTGATIASVSGAFNPVASQWYHVAAERYDDVIRLWVDGAVLQTTPVTATFHTGTAPIVVGGSNNGTQDFTGHIDGVRCIKGTALRSRILPQDYLFIDTEDDSNLLVNFNGVDGATAYTAETGQVFTFNGTAALDDAQRRRGVTSLVVPATTDGVSIANDVSLDVGTGDCTVEFFVRFSTSVVGYRGIFDQRSTGNQASIYIGLNTSSQWVFYFQGADRITGGSPAVDTWYHVALERVNGVWRLYVDGVQIGSDYTNAASVTQNGTKIGADFTFSASSMQGWLDSVRMNAGKAIYGGDFDPPVAAAAEPVV